MTGGNSGLETGLVLLKSESALGAGVAGAPSPLTGCLLLYGSLGASCFSPCFSNQSEELCSKSQGVPAAPVHSVRRRDPLGCQGPGRASVPCSLSLPPFIVGRTAGAHRWVDGLERV